MIMEEIRKEIKRCEKQLNLAYIQFQLAEDHDMIDSCIFKIKSLEAKHKSLINEYKIANIA